MNTSEMSMTKSQERALEYAILKLVDGEVKRMGDTYRVKACRVEKIDYEIISLYMEFDNGKPGTFGYSFPTIAHLFVGKKGGYSTYEGIKRIEGRKALIFCSQKW